MEEKQKQERSFELRSEKVRNIVGQIPSSLVRYGITIIGSVLIILALIAYYLPYKTVYAGSVTIYDLPHSKMDSMEVTIKLRFDGKRIENSRLAPLDIELYNSQGSISGTLLEIATERDTLDRQESIVRFSTKDMNPLSYQTVNFRIVGASESILEKIVGVN